MDGEGVAQMEHRLLAEPELPDGRVVVGLDAFAERQDASPIFWTEFAVVDDQQPRPLKQRILGIRPALPCVEPEPVRAGVVGVLQKLLQDRITGLVAVQQVVPDLVDD